MKKLLLALTLFSIAGCSEYKALPVLTEGSEIVSGVRYSTIEGRVLQKSLPPGASNGVYLGNNWYTFQWDKQCFLIADHNSGSLLTKVKCRN